MNDTPAMTDAPPSANAPLVRWLLVLATGLLVAWCVPRVKPALWFGGLFGLLTGAIAAGLERWWGQRVSAVLAIVCAIVGCAAVFGMTVRLAERAERAAQHDPKQTAAEALLQSMEQGLPLPADGSSPAELIRPAWITATRRYLAVRYRQQPGPVWLWLATEIVSAGLTAGIAHRLMSLRRRQTAEAAP